LTTILLLFAMPAFMGDVLQVFLSNEWSLGRGDIVQVRKMAQRSEHVMGKGFG
jgi:hypothetical protein